MAEGENTFNGLELSMKWRESADFRLEILGYFAEQVPLIYCLEAKPRPQEEELATRLLLQPLECLLFGEDPQMGREKLQQSSSTSQLCGHVFKEGETTYSCRDCAIDPTCVLCMDCFQNSVHKGHRYKMHSSTGGGFCDCGDVEAWKTGPYCTNHEPGSSAAMDTSGDYTLEPGLQERALKLFKVLLSYITDLFVWEENHELSPELQPRVKDDTYYCVLYNDEHHSYDHVIYTLQRSLQCDHREAHAHTVLIDKEGRRAVKLGPLHACQQAKERIRNHSEDISLQPLRVEIIHSTVMAHQSFALRLGTWLHEVIGSSVGFRQLFCQVALEPSVVACQPTLIGRLMLHDAQLYKGARKIIHELIVCSLLMETEYKRLFAIEFTKHYKRLQKDFICDDHDRNISVTALSVQIFTVPTLARQLIEEGNVIKVIVDTVMDMLSEHLDSNNRFHFQGYNSDKFFRIQVIFHDLRYILISKPAVWNNDLRAEFLAGFRTFLSMLTCMQGMEEVKRQLGQHIEVEPEWEAGFSIQMQLRHVLSMFQEWCSSDEEVLLRSFRECHNALLRCSNQPFNSEPTDFYMCKHILHARPYKVSQDPISVHLPISRLLAGLYVQLCRTGAVQRLHEYVDLGRCDFTYFVEHPLRCVVLAAQVSAEMWRRNGLSLVSQVYYYQDVKCRDDMFDKDILMLQIAATKMNPDEFVMLILLRFELFDVFNGNCSTKDQDLQKQWNRLTEEMLHLLIIVIGERYVPGLSAVTKEDMTMREVIHLLCTEPMAHSSLIKGLPENESHETGLEGVITRVATFRKPGVSGHGLYEVKKECLKEFNPFFYHYSKSQHSKAEDAQKKRRVQEGKDRVLPPPVPPPFAPAFAGIPQLLTCDVLLHVLRLVLQRAAEGRGNQWTDAMIQRALHLIAQSLLEEKVQLEASSEDEVSFDFSLKARGIGSEHGKSLFHFLSKMKLLPLLEPQKDMILWTLQLFETVKCLREKSTPTAATSLEHTKPEEGERKRKAEAAKHRQKIMAQMSAMQKNFIETHKALYENVPESSTHGLREASDSADICAMDLGERCMAVGPQRGVAQAEQEVLTCILCQEEQEVKANAPAMVLTACVQRSAVLTQCRGKTIPSTAYTIQCVVVGSQTYFGARQIHTRAGRQPIARDANVHTHTTRHFREHQLTSAGFMDGRWKPEYLEKTNKLHIYKTLDPLFVHPDLAIGTHTGSCGHVMHAFCWQKYFEAVQNSSRSRLHAEAIVDLESGEYMCPLCKSLCNTVIPLVPLEPLPINYEDADLVGELLTLSRWIQIILARVSGLHIKEAGQLSQEAQADFRSILSFGLRAPTKYSDSIGDMLVVCATAIHRVGLKAAPNESDPQVPVMVWNTCAFTIQAVENMLEDENKPLFGTLQNRQQAGLKALIQFAAAHTLKCSPTLVQKHFTRLLAVLIPTMNVEGLPSFLEVDCFSLLVALILSIPMLYYEELADLQPSSISTAFNHLHILHLVTVAHMVQVLLCSHDSPCGAEGDEHEEAHGAAEFCSAVLQCTERLELSEQGCRVAERVRRGVTPYLRCAAIFFNFLTGVPPPEELLSNPISTESQFVALCSYLALPSNLFQLFLDHRETVSPLLERWCLNPGTAKILKSEMRLIRYPRRQNRLIELPDDYSALLNQACHFQCPKAMDDERKHPTLCLFCGAMLCSKSICCQVQLEGEEVGACTAHAASCGAGIGMFLRIRECEVVLMANKTRGSTYPAPYLDDYGETDAHLERGNPLHLSPERYRKLKQMWQQHCLLEEIVRSQEVVSIMFAFEWQML